MVEQKEEDSFSRAPALRASAPAACRRLPAIGSTGEAAPRACLVLYQRPCHDGKYSGTTHVGALSSPLTWSELASKCTTQRPSSGWSWKPPCADALKLERLNYGPLQSSPGSALAVWPACPLRVEVFSSRLDNPTVSNTSRYRCTLRSLGTRLRRRWYMKPVYSSPQAILALLLMQEHT